MAVASSNDVRNTELRNGDLWYYDSTCAAVVLPDIPNLDIVPSPPRGKICTTTPRTALVPAVFLTQADGDQPSRARRPRDGPSHLLPRHVHRAAVAGRREPLRQRRLLLEFDDVFEIKSALVIGGNIDQTLGDAAYLPPGDCADARLEPTVGGADDGFGNTWLLGTGARIDMAANGAVELFHRLQGTQAVSIMAVPATGGGYVATIDRLSDDTATIVQSPGSTVTSWSTV